jgi:hypothetical protein
VKTSGPGPKITKRTSLEDLAGYVCQSLKDAGIEVTLTGGAVVTIYTASDYLSYDLDFVTHADQKRVDSAMLQLGFKRDKGRHFVHPGTPFFVEFPGYAPAIGNMPLARVAERQTRYGMLRLLTPTQSVMDRLAALFHWDDHQAAEQAAMIATKHAIDYRAVRRWAEQEGKLEEYQRWLELSGRLRK